MALISERAAIAADPTFITRVRQAIVEAAVAIHNEADDAANHYQRIRLAERVVQDPDGWAHRIAVAVAGNSNVGTGTSDPSVDDADGDNALGYVVSSIWDTFAATVAP